MKKHLLSLVLVVCMPLMIFAQTKVLSGNLAGISLAGETYLLMLQKGIDSPDMEYINLEENKDGTIKINSEFADLAIMGTESEYTLNPKHQGKKVYVTCFEKSGSLILSSMSATEPVKTNAGQDSQVKQTNEKIEVKTTDYPNASCYVWKSGEIKGICEKAEYFKVYSSTKLSIAKKVQNKDEYCKGTKCFKLKINAKGFITINQLPNVTEEFVWGKIEGNKIYPCKKSDGSDINKNNYLEFKGDKFQAAMLSLMYDYFR